MPFKGRVEIDVTWHDGKTRGKGHGYIGDKAVIFGVFVRGSKIILKMVKSRWAEDVKAFFKESVRDDAGAIHTDEWVRYIGIGDHNTHNETVNHATEKYARGDVKTNGIENVLRLFKSLDTGTFHHISIRNLDAYFDGLERRFNNSENPHIFRDIITKLIGSKPIEFRQLTA